MNKCENCGKELPTYPFSPFNPEEEEYFTLHKYRKEEGYGKKNYSSSASRFFCSKQCIIEYLKENDF